MAPAQDSGEAGGGRKSVRSPLQALYTTDAVSITHNTAFSHDTLSSASQRLIIYKRRDTKVVNSTFLFLKNVFSLVLKKTHRESLMSRMNHFELILFTESVEPNFLFF